MKKYININFPSRGLSIQEESLLDALTDHVLFLEHGLFFQVGDILRHTTLTLSGERKRTLSIGPGRLNNEIEEIEGLINRLRGENRDEYRNILILNERKSGLENALNNEESFPTTLLLGEYFPKEDEIKLYVDNIDYVSNGNADLARHLMAYVLVHECFHSFFQHAGIGISPYFKPAEEPMAEYGSLVMLDDYLKSLSPGSALYNEVEATLECAKKHIEDKKKARGEIAAYGFGAYLYHPLSLNPREFIAKFAKISRHINPACYEAKKYKYMVYPYYPLGYEYLAYIYLCELIEASLTKATTLKPNVQNSQISSGKKDYSKYSLNGLGAYNKREIVYEAVKKYADNNPSLNGQDIVDAFMGLGIGISNLVETSVVHNDRKNKLKSRNPNFNEKQFDARSDSLKLTNGDIIYISNQITLQGINDLIKKVNAQNWNIRIAKIGQKSISQTPIEPISSGKRDYSKYSLNGSGVYNKGEVVYEAVKMYAYKNKSLIAQEVVDAWLELGVNMPSLIETSATYKEREAKSKDKRFKDRMTALELPNDEETIYVSNQFNLSRIEELIDRKSVV